MNNGKVRIYELSRELSLENKDILAICDRLNIAVKSHSSTITEEDAERIRSSARSSQNGAAANGKPNAPRAPKINKNGNRSAGNKQQILEIRRHRPSKPATPPKAPGEVQAPSRPAPPQKRPDATVAVEASKDTPVTPLKPPARPGEADQAAATVAPSPQPPAPAPEPTPPKLNRPETLATVAKQDPVPVDEPVPPIEPVEPESVEPQLAEASQPRPELVNPPARPKPKLSKPASAETPTIKPAAKQPVKPGVESRSQDSSRPSVPIREIVDDEEDTPQLKPKPKLKRPKVDRPQDKEETSTQEKEAETSDGFAPTDVDDDATRLVRPTPPRHKRKSRKDEDDEQEMRNRSSKAAKSRRRGASVDEEEEDFEELVDQHDADDSDAEASHLSISLARPPKPKKQGSSRPSAPVRSHKPPQRDGGGRAAARRERREQESQQERPELLVLTEELTVHELADRIMVPETEIIKSLFFKGIAANINQTLDMDTAKMVAEEFEVLVDVAEAESEAKKITEMLDADDLENLQIRPPVVTIMGHVDHGKTTLLDAIRKTRVAQGEAGGITQHIGAYHVNVEHDGQEHQIVFLDTPGHEAFTAMRARGTRVTDIAILVVAADDGVRPQTIEAISHAKAAEVPLIVAINKVDKETANPDRVKQELMEHGLVPEEWGGDTIMVPVSALARQNLDGLLEMIVLVSEVEDLHANPDRLAKGTVIEANLDKARGPVATLLVQNGTLHVGDCLAAGPVFGKIRAMIDDRGNRVSEALPSYPVEVLGLNDVPAAGDEFEVYADEKQARSVADSRATDQRQSRLQQAMASRRVTLNSLSAQAQEGDLKELNLLLKADVQGSVEAILGSLQQLPQDEVQIRVLLAAPGEISETDVDLAAASGAVIVGFNTTLAPGARQSADRLGVDVRDYDIIYNLMDDIQGAMEGLLEPELVEEPLGQVEVRAVFPVRKGSVAGCYVLSGKVTRNCNLRVLRGGEVIYTGKLDSLKRMKDDVKEVASGFECGIGIDNFNGWQEGDIIDAYRLVTKRRTLTMA